MAREDRSESDSSQHTSDSNEDVVFGESYIEVELSMKQLPGVETLEITTECGPDPDSPLIPSPSHTERKRSYEVQKVVKAYESAALAAVEKRCPSFPV